MNAELDTRPLSCQLDEALAMEAHYRALLLFWKERRQRLEAQLPIDDPFRELLMELLDNDDNGPTDQEMRQM